jgi:hypothetical protein
MGNSQYKEVNQIPDYDTSLTYPLTSKNLVAIHDWTNKITVYWTGPVTRQEVQDRLSGGDRYYCDMPTHMYTPKELPWMFALRRTPAEEWLDEMNVQIREPIFRAIFSDDKSHLTKTCMCGLSPVKYAKKPTVEEYYCVNCGSSRYMLFCSKCEDTEEQYYGERVSHKCKQQKK